MDRLRLVATAEHVRMLLRAGKPDDAARLARRRGLHTYQASSTGANHNRFTTLGCTIALAWVRLMGAQDRVSEALALARQWRSFVNAAQAARAAVEWDIAVAELSLLAGDRLAAQRALEQAVIKAAPGRFIRRFLDEGESTARLLRQMAQGRRRLEDVSDYFLKELVTTLPLADGQTDESDPADDDDNDMTLGGRMSSREIRILSLASSGMPNRQIGEKLGLTEGTVKWYLQQVYDKLGIRDRFQAAEKARQLGLMQ
jgi:LuxR family maltose regulon positive regulatory protein